tara:strand:- start:1027 stop:1338 length:312 start_codon:yes stop_codon:yes gene_type:complete
MKPIDVDAKDFDEFIKGKFVVVDCWSPTCPPCLMLAPVIDELAKEHTEVKFGKVNFANQENVVIAQRFHIHGIPAILVFKNGELVDTLVGYKGKEVLAKELGL